MTVEMLDFVERANRRTLRRPSPGARRQPTKTLPTNDTRPASNPGHIGGRRALSPLSSPWFLFKGLSHIFLTVSFLRVYTQLKTWPFHIKPYSTPSRKCIPGQLSKLQGFVSFIGPSQFFPPKAGSGLSHRRFLVLFPPLHGLLQLDHGDQLLQFP